MPTYEYECKSCSHGFEVFQAMSDLPVKDCPKCGREVRRLIFGGVGVIFKGSGFYVTDKGRAGKTETKKDGSPDSGSVGGASPCASCPESAKSCPGKEKSESKSA